MLTAIALGMTALVHQPLFDDIEAQKVAMHEAGISLAQDDAQLTQEVAVADLQELKGSVTKEFSSASASDVLRWLSGEGINFVVREQDLAGTKLTLNFKGTPKREALRAIGIALGGRWRREGSTYVFQKGGGAFMPMDEMGEGRWMQGEPGRNFVMPKMDGKDFNFTMPKMDGKDFNFVMPKMDGKDFKFAMPEMDEKHMKEMQEHWKMIEPQIKMELKGLEGLKHFDMQGLEKMKDGVYKTKDGKEVRVFRDMKDMSAADKAKWEKEMAKVKEFHKMDLKELQKLKEHSFKTKDGKEVRFYGDHHMSPEEQRKFELKMKEFGEKMRVFGDEMGKMRFEGPDVKVFGKMTDKQKKELEKGLRFKADGEHDRLFISPRGEGRFRVMEDDNIRGLLKSLTPSQRERMNRQGYLNPSDLTNNQRKMLGSLPDKGDWTISYSLDGEKITIKGKG